MTAVAVRASHRGKEVWSVPALDHSIAYGHRETERLSGNSISS
jgi:hypothetical protein